MSDNEMTTYETILDFGVCGRRHVTIIANVRNVGLTLPVVEVDIRSVKVHLPKADIATGLDSFEALHLIEDRHLLDAREALERKFLAYRAHALAAPALDYDGEGPMGAA